MYKNLAALFQDKNPSSLTFLCRKSKLHYYTFLNRIHLNPEKLTVMQIAILAHHLNISQNELFNIILSEYLRKNPLKTGKAQGSTKK